ncbi:TetR/AcrR family transcriptional regulator [bacterium]|nr:TetR/AcrR family transcriptional regulator [bacterium]
MNHSDKQIRFYFSAEPLFERYGFRKTTIEDICKVAGMSKRTFYDLFKDKSDFFAHLALHIAEEMLAEWSQSLADNKSATEKISEFIDFYIDTVVQRPIFHIMMQDMETFEAFGTLGAELNLSPIIHTLRNIINAGTGAGEFREQDTDTTVWIITSLLDTMFLLTPAMFKDTIEFKNNIMKNEVKSFIINGLKTSGMQ